MKDKFYSVYMKYTHLTYAQANLYAVKSLLVTDYDVFYFEMFRFSIRYCTQFVNFQGTH